MVGNVPVIGLETWEVEGVQAAATPQEAVQWALEHCRGGA
jgi:hypothetical protein